MSERQIADTHPEVSPPGKVFCSVCMGGLPENASCLKTFWVEPELLPKVINTDWIITYLPICLPEGFSWRSQPAIVKIVAIDPLKTHPESGVVSTTIHVRPVSADQGYVQAYRDQQNFFDRTKFTSLLEFH